MKRSALQRKTPLKGQQAALKRRTQLGQGVKPLQPRATPRKRESDEARNAREAWHNVPDDAPCVACGKPVRGAPPHHVVPKQVLKHVAEARGIPAWFLLWDERVRVIVCLPCHAAHENASPRLRFSCLSTPNLTSASDLGCERYLGPRYYR